MTRKGPFSGQECPYWLIRLEEALRTRLPMTASTRSQTIPVPTHHQRFAGFFPLIVSIRKYMRIVPLLLHTSYLQYLRKIPRLGPVTPLSSSLAKISSISSPIAIPSSTVIALLLKCVFWIFLFIFVFYDSAPRLQLRAFHYLQQPCPHYWGRALCRRYSVLTFSCELSAVGIALCIHCRQCRVHAGHYGRVSS